MKHRQKQFYRHVGVYDVCYKEGKLLVIEKKIGAYKGKYDVPGGTLEHYESLTEGLYREVLEETGYNVSACTQIGITDIFTTYNYDEHTIEELHHLGILYDIDISPTDAPAPLANFAEQDSNGAHMLPLSSFNKENASPLLLEAIHWIKTKTLSPTAQRHQFL